MSEPLLRFRGPAGPVLLALGFDLDGVLADWESLRVPMTRTLPEVFARDEWAYLISFLDARRLRAVFEETFGAPDSSHDPVRSLYRPVGRVATWLPNNVSLLGPLTLVLLSLTGARLDFKGGSKSEDLTAAFLGFARENLDRTGPLAGYLEDSVRHEVFERSDPRNAHLASEADVRIVFGSDETVRAVEMLPHTPGSTTIAFRDKRSEAWIEPAALDESVRRTLLRVFAVYGQAGCTSPRRVVLLGGSLEAAQRLARDLAERWDSAVRRAPAPHEASSAVLGDQWARALGWETVRAPNNAAVFAAGTAELESFEVPLGLAIVAASEREALASLPENIQTLGHAFAAGVGDGLVHRLAARGVDRFVPLAKMHHFGPVWDGVEFWRRCFERMEIGE